jgi:hypothetical protein
MEKIFNFEELAGYELYHLRYGKGAVIIAIPKENDEELIAIWDQYEQKAAEDSRSKMKPIKQKIFDLKVDLGEAFRVRIQKKEKSMSEEENRIKGEIERLEEELKNLAHVTKKYYTNMQLAMFYTHNISPQSEVDTRFDKILNIEELDSHVKMVLQFTDKIHSNHVYHKKIESCSYNASDRRTGANILEGVVTRIVPIDSVTLEIIERPILQ